MGNSKYGDVEVIHIRKGSNLIRHKTDDEETPTGL